MVYGGALGFASAEHKWPICYTVKFALPCNQFFSKNAEVGNPSGEYLLSTSWEVIIRNHPFCMSSVQTANEIIFFFQRFIKEKLKHLVQQASINRMTLQVFPLIHQISGPQNLFFISPKFFKHGPTFSAFFETRYFLFIIKGYYHTTGCISSSNCIRPQFTLVGLIRSARWTGLDLGM
jgi:hypothetical protein